MQPPPPPPRRPPPDPRLRHHVSTLQVRAIIEAALNCKDRGVDARPDIMVPLIGTTAELKHQAALIRRVAEEVFAERGKRIDFKVGTMIEVPRAALLAGEIAEDAEFFSYGTNDLTQMTFGYSRDDVSKFLGEYLRQGILKYDPFQVRRWRWWQHRGGYGEASLR